MRYYHMLAPEALPEGFLEAEGEDPVTKQAIDLIQRAIDQHGICWLAIEAVDYDLYLGRVAASRADLGDPCRSLFLALTHDELEQALAIEPHPHTPKLPAPKVDLVALAPMTFSGSDVACACEQVRQSARSSSRDVLWLRTLLWLLTEERSRTGKREASALERDLKAILSERRRLPHLRHQRLVNVAGNYRRSTDEVPTSYEITVGWGLDREPLSAVYSTLRDAAA